MNALMLNIGPIQELPLSHPFFRKKVESFLLGCGLRLDSGLERYFGVLTDDGDILAGAGIQADIIKCVAVAPCVRSEGLLTPLISHVMSESSASNFKVFTKPENRAVFESLGFKVLAIAPKAILMENGRGLEEYCSHLRSMQRPGRSGVVVMNANPFTLGHKFLLEKASAQVDTLFVIPVKEDVSAFPYAERAAMIRAALPDSIIVLEGCDYVISSATFPTYFLKDLSDVSETQMLLDLDLFSKWIAPSLGASVRFVGSEPYDALTARYNHLMKQYMDVVEIERIPISATAVRAAIDSGLYGSASALTPQSTHPYLLAALAERALRIELDTPLKPGLVGPDSCGAHKDMDYALMKRGIKALRPFWSRMALASGPQELKRLGIEAEEAMLAATGGVNTHRGAIFALGLTIYAAAKPFDNQSDIISRVHAAVHPIISNSLTDNELRESLVGAKRIAMTGYRQLFEDWLPYYRNLRTNGQCAGETANQMLLLHIMSTLDDTCVIKRVGYKRAQDVKRETSAVLREIAGQTGNDDTVMPDLIGHLKPLCDRYAGEGISPGGAADMLALTIFIDSII